MAIMEFLEETYPKVKLLPEDPLTRAKVLPTVMMQIGTLNISLFLGKRDL